MALGELNLKDRQHREAVELFVSVCRRYHEGDEPSRHDYSQRPVRTQTVYPAINPPSDRGEVYLGILEDAGFVRVQRFPHDPSSGIPYIPDLAFENGTVTVVEPTEEGFVSYLEAKERAEKKTQ